jgi:hypothetical protein
MTTTILSRIVRSESKNRKVADSHEAFLFFYPLITILDKMVVVMMNFNLQAI